MTLSCFENLHGVRRGHFFEYHLSLRQKYSGQRSEVHARECQHREFRRGRCGTCVMSVWECSPKISGASVKICSITAGKASIGVDERVQIDEGKAFGRAPERKGVNSGFLVLSQLKGSITKNMSCRNRPRPRRVLVLGPPRRSMGDRFGARVAVFPIHQLLMYCSRRSSRKSCEKDVASCTTTHAHQT